MNLQKLRKASKVLFIHRLNCKGLNSLPTDCVPLNINEAYKIQDELKNLYLTLNQNYILGKKMVVLMNGLKNN